ncbi:hydantoinase B/oxoprolinase family protein [Candidatus Pacearchaeota archaeon]|nr:hydantoinase B/oxoprolinase family protein [Candidatus Pacearchaeota archaeon]
MKVDIITLEVIYHRLKSITDEMENALLKSSFSTIVKETRDCSTALFNAQGQTIAQATAIPIHLGTLMESVPGILKFFPASEMQEGDVYIANDPYTGGTHLPDITMVVPIIYQKEVVALSCSMVHHQDIGGMTPGVSTTATSIYQEGLNLPPLKLYNAGTPVKVVYDIIRKNVRTPELVIGDLESQVAAGNVGKLRILELFNEYNKELVLAAMNQLMDHSETLVRRKLENIPDGTYTFVDFMDNDGVDIEKCIKIRVTVTIKGSEFIVDFSGTNSQVKGPFNCSPSSVLSAICYVVMAITDPNIPCNAGCFRSITMKLPEASILNPCSPAALGARASTIFRVSDAIMGALVQAIPERLPAASGGVSIPVVYFGGIDPLTSKEYCAIEPAVGGSGARPNNDGIDVISTDVANILNVPVEAIEMNFPIRVIKSGLYEGSGGAGEYRGGLGLAKVMEILRGDASVTFRGERFFTPCWGLLGGTAGFCGKGFIIRQSGKEEEIPSKRDLVLHEGDQVHLFSPGGGGYGDPLKRKLEAVLKDVLSKRISFEAAARDYGVVIDKELMTLDKEKTSELRKEKARQRGPITWVYDRARRNTENETS